MLNLLGELGFGGVLVVEGLVEVLIFFGVVVYFYGKDVIRVYCKMGYVIVLDDTVDGVLVKVE